MPMSDTSLVRGGRLPSRGSAAAGRLACVLSFLPWLACGANEAEPEEPTVLEIEIAGALAETPGSPWGGPQTPHRALLDRLRTSAEGDDVTGLFLRVHELGTAWARGEDLARALARFRENHKPVHCYFEVTDNLGYALLAKSCDRITMTPAGLLNLVGLRAEVLYAAELLATIGLSADLVQIGRYKGAIESLTRDTMTDETRETLSALLDAMVGHVLDAVAKGRSLPPEKARAIVDEGPFDAGHAKRAGLVDAVGFDDAARTHAKTAAKATRVSRVSLDGDAEQPSFGAFVRALTGDRPSGPRGARIAVAFLEGTILQGDEHSSESAHAVPFVAAMRRFASDEDVRAVVLRIDSPGGSAMASDLMWHAVQRVAKRKPVIVSIGDMAASGGYYVASAGTEILARDTSLVGSIGVVSGKVVLEELATKVGVHVERITRGRHAGWTSSLARFSDEERTAITALARSTYRLFLERVSAGREMSAEELQPWAEGRLFTGARAREGGLVDREGGYEEALALARERGELDADSPVETWPREQSFFDAIQELARGGASSKTLEGALSLLGAARTGIVEVLLADESPVATVLPWTVRIR